MTAPNPTNQDKYNPVPISVDDAAESISALRRRLVILFTAEHNTPLTVGELAEGIAAIETDQPMSQLESQERKRVYISLYQHHLKTLNGTGAISYDDRAKRVYDTNVTNELANIIHQMYWVFGI